MTKKIEVIIKAIRDNRLFYVFFFLLFLINMAWLAAFWPGLLSVDSIYHWKQASTLVFDGITPYIYTVIIIVLRRIFDSPASVAIFQVITSSLIISYFLNTFVKNNNLKRASVYLLFSIYIIIPVFAIYNITLWKDALFAQGILLLSLLWVMASISKKSPIRDNRRLILMALLVTFVSLIRLNGIIYLGIVPLTYLFLEKKGRVLVFTGLLLSFYVLFSVLTPRVLRVDNQRAGFFSEANKIQMLSSVIKHEGYISDYDKGIISKIMPIEEFRRRYHCSAIDYLYIDNSPFNEKVFYDATYSKEFNQTFQRIFLNNIGSSLLDRACLLQYSMGLGEQKYQYYYQLVIPQNDFGIRSGGLPLFRQYASRYLDWTTHQPQVYLFWFNLVYVLIFVIYSFKALFRRNYIFLIFAFYVLVNIPALLVFGVARDFRYYFMVIYSIPFAPIIYALGDKFPWEFPKRYGRANSVARSDKS